MSKADPSVGERMRKYRLKNLREGKCWKCPSPQYSTFGLCLRHVVLKHLSKHGLTKGVLDIRDKRKREAFIGFVLGREAAIRAGFLTPGDDAQRLKEVTEARLRLNIRWGGVRGADKMAHVVRLIDLAAMRRRNGQGQAQV